MNKGQQFWIDLWQRGEIPFHKNEVNPDLINCWPSLNCPTHARVLVPLCGKSVDLLWLQQQGYQVVGIELSEEAIRQFIQEHQLHMSRETIGSFLRFFNQSFEFWVADIFALTPQFISSVDAIYDRAALIALPVQLRQKYVSTCLQWLKAGGKVLLQTFELALDDGLGPPYSISKQEVFDLYGRATIIDCIKTSTRHVSRQEKQVKVEEALWLIGI